MPARKPLVLLIHGLNSAGEWMDEVAGELAPFYRVEKIRYRHYRWLGFLKVASARLGLFWGVLAMAAWLAALAAWGAGYRCSWDEFVTGRRWWLGTMVWGTGFLLWAGLNALRTWCIHNVTRKIGRHNPGVGGAMHIIAHSLGSFLFGQIGPKILTAFWGKIVLLGCVLPRNFAWSRFYRSRGPRLRAFHSVRNEVGTADLVVRMTGLAGRLHIAAGVGDAGLRGFVPPSEQDTFPIHNLESTWEECPDCPGKAFAGSLHNVSLADYGHSTFAVTPAHARDLWLPVLWGLEPVRYAMLVQRATQLFAQPGDSGLQGALGAVVTPVIRGSSLWWTIDEQIVAQIAALRNLDPGAGGRASAETLRIRCLQRFAKLLLEANSTDAPEEEKVLREPWQAVRRGVRDVVLRGRT